jgi:pimeloyl-ACP methyl ester carboxylesterase
MFTLYRIVLLLFLVGCCDQLAATQRKAADGSAASFEKIVDIGGRHLFIRCSGVSTKADPVVVLDAGMGNSSEVWSLVQPQASRFSRVCSYDRAGMGKSDKPPHPASSEDIVSDLHRLLEMAGIRAPYVLVGHSFGGMNVRLFASRYPNEVKGLVLVDSSHEDEIDRTIALLPAEQVKKTKPEDMVVLGPEGVDFIKSIAQLRAANWHGEIPLVVLTRGTSGFNPNDYPVPTLAPMFEKLRLELQQDLVKRSRRGKQVFAEKSGHNIHRDEPGLVVDAIRQGLEEARSLASK